MQRRGRERAAKSHSGAEQQSPRMHSISEPRSSKGHARRRMLHSLTRSSRHPRPLDRARATFLPRRALWRPQPGPPGTAANSTQHPPVEVLVLGLAGSQWVMVRIDGRLRPALPGPPRRALKRPPLVQLLLLTRVHCIHDAPASRVTSHHLHRWCCPAGSGAGAGAPSLTNPTQRALLAVTLLALPLCPPAHRHGHHLVHVPEPRSSPIFLCFPFSAKICVAASCIVLDKFLQR